MRKINCYILFPTLSQNNSMFNCKDLYRSIDDSSTFKDFLKPYQEMIEIAECEKGVNLFYDSENIQDLQKDIVELNQEYISPQFSFAVLLSNAENVRDKQQLKLHNFYFLWDMHTSTAISIISPISILSVVAEQIHQNERRRNDTFMELMKAAKSATEKSEMKNEFIRLTTAFINIIDINKYIFLHNNCIKIDRLFIPVIIEFSTLKENPVILSIEHTTNKINFKEWINENRQPRIFMLYKHGEKGIGAHPDHKGKKVSVLLCDKERAQELLDKAIGDRRISKDLYNYDKEYQRFIIFKDSNTLNNEYHGFHLDSGDEHTIPDRIRQLLEEKEE